MNVFPDHPLDLNALKDVFLCANTPTYLYSHFRRNSSVQLLAKTFKADDLFNCLKDLLKQPVTEVMVAVKAYALFVSLSLKSNHELGELRRFSSQNIEWFEKIKTLVLEDAPNAYNISFNLSKPPTTEPKRGTAEKGSNVASNSAEFTVPNPYAL